MKIERVIFNLLAGAYDYDYFEELASKNVIECSRRRLCCDDEEVIYNHRLAVELEQALCARDINILEADMIGLLTRLIIKDICPD